MIPLAIPSHMALFFHFSVRRSVKEGSVLDWVARKYDRRVEEDDVRRETKIEN